MSDLPAILGAFVKPGLLYTLIPVGVLVLGLVSFEVAVAITISTLPRSRFQHKWTPQEQRRVLRVFLTVFSVWPIAAGLILGHVYLPLWIALFMDGLVLVLLGLGVRGIAHRARERRLIAAGHCMHCFYDLRASRERDHCPECGTGLADHPTRVTISR